MTAALRSPSFPLRNGLPPIPALIPSPTSPGMKRFSHFKQTISPGKSPRGTPVVTNGNILSPTRRDLHPIETTRIESFSRSPVFEKSFVVSRKREHSPEKNHFNFETSFIAAATKKPFVPIGKPLYPPSTSQVPDILPRTTAKPLYGYGIHSMPMVPNGPGGPGRDIPRMSRRDPVVPTRLSDYELEHFGALHHKFTREVKSPDDGTKYNKSFKNGHATVKNGHVRNNIAKKEPTKVPVNTTLPSNKPVLSNNVESVLSPKSSDEDSAISTISPNSPFQREFQTQVDRKRRISSSSTDSGHEEPREGMGPNLLEHTH